MKTICIAGKNDIAVDVLSYCLNKFKNARVVCIITRNELGVNSWQKSLKWFAEKKQVDIITLHDAYEIEDMLFISTEFDRIIRPEKFKTQELYNIHFSMLPKYKGCGLSVLPILNGESSTGVTLHRIRAGIDTGEIIAQREVQIDNDDCSLDLYKKLIAYGTELVIEYLDRLILGEFDTMPQEKNGSTYFDIDYIDYGNLKLNVNRTAFQIRNQIRAFAFRPYQLLKWNDECYLDAEITDEVSGKKPGTVLAESVFGTKIATIDYDIILIKDTLNKLFKAIKVNDNNLAKKMCYSMKVIEAQDEHGWSPLTVAVCNNNLDMVKFLIKRGANIYVLDNNGRNLLMYAKNCYLDYKDYSIYNYLLNLGLSPEQEDYNGKNLYDYCKEDKIDSIGVYRMI